MGKEAGVYTRRNRPSSTAEARGRAGASEGAGGAGCGAIKFNFEIVGGGAKALTLTSKQNVKLDKQKTPGAIVLTCNISTRYLNKRVPGQRMSFHGTKGKTKISTIYSELCSRGTADFVTQASPKHSASTWRVATHVMEWYQVE